MEGDKQGELSADEQSTANTVAPHSQYTLTIASTGTSRTPQTQGILRSGERWLERMARRRTWCCIAVALLAFALRAALVPLLGIPKPVVHDEFAYLLGGETFAKGRLTNPPHPLSEFFETFHVNVQPTYTSKYPPAQAVMLALGIFLTGNPWFGVLLSVSLMCGLVCWAVQGWLPPIYGLYAGLFTFLIFGLVHYWVTSYWGGAITACGGALVVGAVPRLFRRPGPVVAAAAVCGILILANSRPYEGLVFTCVTAVTCLWKSRRKSVIRPLLRPRTFLPALLILVMGLGGMAYYNFVVTGNPATMPYTVNMRQNAVVPLFWVLPPFPPAHHEYRDQWTRDFWQVWEVNYYNAARHHPINMVKWAAEIVLDTLYQDLSPAAPLTIPLALALIFAKRRDIAVILALLGGFAAGLCLEKLLFLHYAAPATAAFLILAMQGMRILRTLKIGRQKAGLRLTALVLAAGVGLAGLQVVDYYENARNQKPKTAVDDRWAVEDKLDKQPGQHVVIVRYGPEHSIHREIVYNGPDIDAQKVVWAIDRGQAEDQKLLDYYRGRHIWLLQPDPPAMSLKAYGESAKAN